MRGLVRRIQDDLQEGVEGGPAAPVPRVRPRPGHETASARKRSTFLRDSG